MKFLRTSFLKFYMISSHCASSVPLEPKTSISPTISIDRLIVDIVYLFLASQTVGDGRHLMFIHSMTQFDINCIIKCHQKKHYKYWIETDITSGMSYDSRGGMPYDIERGERKLHTLRDISQAVKHERQTVKWQLRFSLHHQTSRDK